MTRRRPKSGRRTQAERRAASERRVLDAAAQLIAERGTSSVSFADIARRAGCSHGLPGYLFGSKTNLLLALVDQMLGRFRDEALTPALGGDVEDRGLPAILKVLEIYLASLANPWPATRALYVLIGEAPGCPPELHAALAAHHAAARHMLAATLTVARDRGEVRADIDPAAQATILLGHMRGIGAQVLLDPEAVDVAAITAEVLESTRRALRPQ